MPSLNIEYTFYLIYSSIKSVYSWFVSLSVSPPLWLVVFWAFLSFVFLFLIFLLYHKTRDIQIGEKLALEKAVEETVSAHRHENKEWQKILSYLDSEKQTDWKIAIIEADILLEKLVSKMGYKGETLGEKLQSIEPSDFLTLNLAWEAHKVRNKLAHESTNLSQREAKRVLNLYRQVFDEFYFI